MAAVTPVENTWDAEDEIQLFFALGESMLILFLEQTGITSWLSWETFWDSNLTFPSLFTDGLRPFGQNKHFYMAVLVERLMNKLGKDINSSILWTKLKSMYNLSALDEAEPTSIDLEEESDFMLPESYLNHKMSTVDSTDDVEDESETRSETGSKSETPVSSITVTSNSGTGSANNTLQVIKEVETSRTRNSTPARETSANNTNETHSGSAGSSSSTTKRTQPKRTRASISTNDTPNSSPSTPTPTGPKRRRI